MKDQETAGRAAGRSREAAKKLPAGVKACGKCQVVKPHSEFYRDKSRPSGRNSWCRECCKGPCSRCQRLMAGRKPGQVCKPCRQELREQEAAERLAAGAKACSKCQAVKPFSEFYRDKSRPDRHDCQCKECASDTACSRCGRRLVSGHGMLPEPVCQPCRRLNGRFGPWTCEQCGETFERYQADPVRPPRFCKMQCYGESNRIWMNPRSADKASARYRRLRHRETWDRVEDEQIFERDGWACLIPGCTLGIVRFDLAFPEPLSPSVDHIVPVSLGGADTAPNKRTAHLICNTRRGPRMHPDDVQLISPVLAPLGLLPPRNPPKPAEYCMSCETAEVSKAGAICPECRKAARDKATAERQQWALGYRESGMAWKDIAVLLELSGPGAAYNIAYPPWGRYKLRDAERARAVS